MTEMPCSRKGCNAVDCRIEVVGKGYICWECVEELREKRKEWPEEMTELEAKLRVYSFLDTEKTGRKLSGDEVLLLK